MSNIYDTIKAAYAESGLLMVDSALERFSSSLGCHLLNLINIERRYFFHASKLMNFREHIVFQAPSGFTKSVMLDFFLHPKSGVLSQSPFPTNVEATFTGESWVGTIVKDEDGREATDGVFERYKTGIIGADEYATLKDMAENPGDRNDVVYLLKALDDGRCNKNMAYGVINIENIGMTFWCGMRPTRLQFTSGLGRRFTYQVFFPTWREAKEFKTANMGNCLHGMIQNETKLTLRGDIMDFLQEGREITEINYDQVDEWLMNNDLIPHFDMTHYRRLATGWSIVNGTYPDVRMDEFMIGLFKNEYEARRTIRNNPVNSCVLKVIADEEDGFNKKFLYEFLDAYYQIPKNDSRSIIRSLKMSELIRERNNNFIATEQAHDDAREAQEVIQEFITLGSG